MVDRVHLVVEAHCDVGHCATRQLFPRFIVPVPPEEGIGARVYLRRFVADDPDDRAEVGALADADVGRLLAGQFFPGLAVVEPDASFDLGPGEDFRIMYATDYRYSSMIIGGLPLVLSLTIPVFAKGFLTQLVELIITPIKHWLGIG